MFNYPDPLALYIEHTENGSLLEKRNQRSGCSGMKVGTFVNRYEITNVEGHMKQVPELNFPVLEYGFLANIEVNVPTYLLGEIKRFETISWWMLSYQEILRHLAKAQADFVSHPYWPHIMEVLEPEKQNLFELQCKWHDIVNTEGDFSDKQWAYYVNEHEASAYPGEDFRYWWELAADPQKSIVGHKETDQWIGHYFDAYQGLPLKNRLVRAIFTYPSMRSREGDYTIISQTDYSYKVYVTKWRCRKVGGVKGLSQISYPVYHREAAKHQHKLIVDWIGRFLKCEVRSLELEGPALFLDLYANKNRLFTYDIKIAEKVEGLLFPFLGYAVDLGDPRFPPELAPEVYSGVGPTGPLSEIAGAIIIRALVDLMGLRLRKIYIFHDNWVIDCALQENPFFDKADTFCGFLVQQGRFGPVSLVTDNPKHRINFNGKHQLQVQGVQYVMRPLLSALMNNVFTPTSCERFLKYIVQKKLIDTKGEDDYRKDVLNDMILANTEAHADIIATFQDEVNGLGKFMYLQSKNPEYSADLKVYT